MLDHRLHVCIYKLLYLPVQGAQSSASRFLNQLTLILIIGNSGIALGFGARAQNYERGIFMENSSVKMSLQAFLVGGLVGAATQGFLTIYSTFISDFGMAVNLSLLTLGTLGGILTAVGIFGKMDKFGGMGVNIPTIGLGAAVTGSIIAKRAEGNSTGQAVLKGLVPALTLLGTAAVIGFIAAVIKNIIG